MVVFVLMLVLGLVLDGDGEVLALQATGGRAALVVDAYIILSEILGHET